MSNHLSSNKIERHDDGLSWIQKLHGWIVPLALVVIWEVAAALHLVSATTLPAPSSIITQFFSLIASGELFRHLGISAYRAGLGFYWDLLLDCCLAYLQDLGN